MRLVFWLASLSLPKVVFRRNYRIAFLVFALLPGCHRARRKPLASAVNTADPSVSKQLVGGFYKIEQKSWRWSAREFIVSLAPPSGADHKGAILKLHFYLPETQIARLGPMTLTAEIDDATLRPETYSRPGDYFYVRDVPADLLHTNPLPVIFSFDKAVPPGTLDDRELGAVVTSISLSPE